MNHPALRVAGYYLGGVLVGNETGLSVHWLWGGGNRLGCGMGLVFVDVPVVFPSLVAFGIVS